MWRGDSECQFLAWLRVSHVLWRRRRKCACPKRNLLKQVAREAGLLLQRGGISKNLCPGTFLGPDSFTWGAEAAPGEGRRMPHTRPHHHQRPRTLADIPRTYGPAFTQA